MALQQAFMIAVIMQVFSCGILVNADWIIDERCQHRNLQGFVDESSPAAETPSLRSDNELSNGNLRGNGRSARDLQQQFTFRMKMFWREGYCWQEEWIERKWCMSCNGGTCNVGDTLWLQECSDAEIQLFTWEPVPGTGGGKLKPFTYQGLCLERTSTRANGWELFYEYGLRPCDDGNMDTQILTGWQEHGPFELYPFGESLGFCITQKHHPKPKETVVAEHCNNARIDHTNYWVVYNASLTTAPATIPKAPWEICHPGSLLAKNENVTSNQPIFNQEYNASLEQWTNGNLVVKQQGTTIWESNVNETEGIYYTKLQGNGNLVTWQVASTTETSSVWSSKIEGPSTLDYFVGLDCNVTSISIYEYTPDDPGNVIWSSGSDSSMVGSITTLPPTLAPFNHSQSLLLAPSKHHTVPFKDMSALEFTDFYDSDLEHRGNCGIGPVDASVTDSLVCHDWGSQCSIISTSPQEWLQYTFKVSHDAMVDVSLMMSSERDDKRIRIEIDGIPGYGEAFSKGTNFTDFQRVVAWRMVSLPAGVHAMNVSFVNGQINLCAVGVTFNSFWASTLSEEELNDLVAEPELTWGMSGQPSTEVWEPTSAPSLEPSVVSSLDTTLQSSQTPALDLQTVPFDMGALEYISYVDFDDEHHGDCGSGPVDSSFVSDEVCQSRNGRCAIEGTQAGEMVEYNFEMTTSNAVDIVVRVADANAETLRVVIPGIAATFINGPGRGLHGDGAYQDKTVWSGIFLPAGIHNLRLYFLGQMYLCAISVRGAEG